MHSSEVDTVFTPTKKRPQIFPDNFLSSNMCCLALLELISKSEGHEKTQINIDNWYGLFCDIMCVEINTHFPIKPDLSHKGSHKKIGRTKPYWNAELDLKLWNDKGRLKGKFLKCKNPSATR